MLFAVTTISEPGRYRSCSTKPMVPHYCRFPALGGVDSTMWGVVFSDVRSSCPLRSSRPNSTERKDMAKMGNVQ